MIRTRLAAALGVSLALSCRCGQEAPQLNADDSLPQVSPGSLDFGTVLTGSLNQKPLDLGNAGARPMAVSAATIAPASAGDRSFSVDLDGGVTVASGESIALPVHFDPVEDGVHDATLTLTTDSQRTPEVQVALHGVSYSYRVSIVPSTLDFGEVQVGTTSAPKAFTVTDDSTVPETLALGPLSPDAGFSLTPAEPSATLQAGSAITFQATFAPASPGKAQATFPVVPCPSCAAEDVTLSGTGVDTILQATPAQFAFGDVPPGVTVSQLFRVQAVSLPADSISKLPAEPAAPLLGSGTDGGTGFTVEESGAPDPWPFQLLPPDVVQLTVGFIASTPPAVQDTVVIPYSVGAVVKPPLIIPVSAGSLSTPCSGVTVAPQAVDFGPVKLGQVVSQQVTLTNGGSQTCQLTNVGIGQNDAQNDFSLPSGTQTSLTMPAGMQATFSVDFAPTSATPPLLRKGTFIASANQQQPPQIVVPLSAEVSGSATDAGTPGSCYGNGQYSYSCVWQGTQVSVAHWCNSTTEGFPDMTIVGTCDSFTTNDPQYSCLNGENINTFVAPQEMPGIYLVHNGDMGGQCTYGLWTFQLP